MIEARGIDGVGSGLFTAPASPNRSRASRWLQQQLKRMRREGRFTIAAELTPELAELFLQANGANRKPSPEKLAAYIRDIKGGHWQHNGATLVIAETGELNDGQHRCMAVVEAGRSIVTEIHFGAPRETRTTIDTGMKRTVGQHLQMRGHVDSNVIAAGVARIIHYDRSGRFGKPTFALRPTTTEIIEFAERFDLGHHIRVGHGIGVKLKCKSGVLVALHYVLSRKSAIDADRFFDALRSGENLQGPIHKLREKLQDAAKGRRRLTDDGIAEMVITAWNAYRRGRNLRSLPWPAGGPLPAPV